MIVIDKSDYDCLATDFSDYMILNKTHLIV